MPSNPEPTGCRHAAIATGILVGVALVFMAIGLTLINDSTCDPGCETLGLTLLYAGLPVSSVFGVLFGDLVLAWPLDITLWVVAGFGLARFSDRRRHGVLGPVLLVVLAALIYGLVLSRFVEIAM
ncbi:MAG: hypothetical protein ACRDU9_09895 [Acidimicrobiia bacterium]